MYRGIKRWSQFDPIDELLKLRLLKKFTLVLMDKCQNTQCIDADWSGSRKLPCILRVSFTWGLHWTKIHHGKEKVNILPYTRMLF